MGASVKIMLSYDYCHFEICKGTDQPMTDQEIDAMRKDCQRLADKAIQQYRIAKACESRRALDKGQRIYLEREAVEITTNVPEELRTPKQQAKVKAWADTQWVERYQYDYEDDFSEPDDWDNEI